jgi:hypothetical protein
MSGNRYLLDTNAIVALLQGEVLSRISHKLDKKVDIVNGFGNNGVKYLHQSDESMRITKIMAPQ